MRLGSGSSDGFITELNAINSQIQDKFVEKMKAHTQSAPVKVMLGDATVTEQVTFDPALVGDYFKSIIRHLADWDVQDLTVTNNEDIRRMFTKYHAQEGSYVISGHMSIQFHVLLYYKTDQRVLGAQKELAGILDTTKEKESELAVRGDRIIMEKLKELGYSDVAPDTLFKVLFENDTLREQIHAGIDADSDPALATMSARRKSLFDELDCLLMETYQTSPVLIDDARLVTGEEGFLCAFDIEYVKDNVKNGMFDPRKIPDRVKQDIKQRLLALSSAV